MKKITKAAFIDYLCNHQTILAGSVFRWNDGRLLRAVENIKPEKTDKRRVVTEKHANFLMFSDGGRLDFNQQGKKEYFLHTNATGTDLIWQKRTTFDEFDKKNEYHYIVYILAN